MAGLLAEANQILDALENPEVGRGLKGAWKSARLLYGRITASQFERLKQIHRCSRRRPSYAEATWSCFLEVCTEELNAGGFLRGDIQLNVNPSRAVTCADLLVVVPVTSPSHV
jgi:hypothetical protein